MRAEPVELAFGHVESHDTAAYALFHDEIDREVLDEEGRGVLYRLLIERVEHRVTGAIGRGASALGDTLSEVRRHAAEGALINASCFRAGERHAVVLPTR